MGFEEYQKQVDEWTSGYTPQYWPPHEQFTRLSEEVGELAREINHIHGTKKKKVEEGMKNIGAEMSDIIFTTICLANSHNINLQEEWDKMMNDKMYGRDANRFDRKE